MGQAALGLSAMVRVGGFDLCENLEELTNVRIREQRVPCGSSPFAYCLIDGMCREVPHQTNDRLKKK